MPEFKTLVYLRHADFIRHKAGEGLLEGAIVSLARFAHIGFHHLAGVNSRDIEKISATQGKINRQRNTKQ